MTKSPLTYDLFPNIEQTLNVQDLLDLIDPNGKGDKRVHALESNWRDPSTPNEIPWTRVVIMERTNLFDTPDHIDQAIPVEPQIRVDHYPPENVEGYNMNAFMQVVHQKIYELLQGKLFSLENATMSMPLYRISRPIFPMQDDQGFYFSNSIFKTILSSYE